jgi:hypothetical protein
MIEIKEIKWIYSGDNNPTSHRHYSAIVNNYSFLSLQLFEDEWYIHVLSPTIETQGVNGINKWGTFKDVDECKYIAEKIIRENILSFLDIRTTNINFLL